MLRIYSVLGLNKTKEKCDRIVFLIRMSDMPSPLSKLNRTFLIVILISLYNIQHI